jgi:hypothetical protein
MLIAESPKSKKREQTLKVSLPSVSRNSTAVPDRAALMSQQHPRIESTQDQTSKYHSLQPQSKFGTPAAP